MAHSGFDEQMAALDALKNRPHDDQATALLKKSLGSRSNLLAAKAAKIAEESQLTALLPELLAAYDRFFKNPEKTDPQCWAKNALSRALLALGCREKQVFLRGLHHVQLEPTWGGRSDSAAALRANCAHALVACGEIPNDELLRLLLELLADPDKSVRVEAARAIGQIGPLAAPVLRLRALIAGEEPEVIAACFAAVAAIEGDAVIPFLAGFLDKDDERAGEAAFALAERRSPKALAVLLQRLERPADSWLTDALISAVALLRLPEANEFLLALIAEDKEEAEMALDAFSRFAPADLRERIQQAVGQSANPALARAFRKAFGDAKDA